jgi:type IX secretion system PorP/SprF family membrane protein
MKRLKVAFLFLIIIAGDSFGQQDPTFSQYMFNMFSFNPGYAGINSMFCATALSRQQWVGFKGAPSTNVFNVTAPVSPFHIKSGVGINVESDNLGFEKDILLSGSYSYLMDVGAGKLGLGISLGMLNMSL